MPILYICSNSVIMIDNTGLSHKEKKKRATCLTQQLDYLDMVTCMIHSNGIKLRVNGSTDDVKPAGIQPYVL